MYNICLLRAMWKFISSEISSLKKAIEQLAVNICSVASYI